MYVLLQWRAEAVWHLKWSWLQWQQRQDEEVVLHYLPLWINRRSVNVAAMTGNKTANKHLSLWHLVQNRNVRLAVAVGCAFVLTLSNSVLILWQSLDWFSMVMPSFVVVLLRSFGSLCTCVCVPFPPVLVPRSLWYLLCQARIFSTWRLWRAHESAHEWSRKNPPIRTTTWGTLAPSSSAPIRGDLDSSLVCLACWFNC